MPNWSGIYKKISGMISVNSASLNPVTTLGVAYVRTEDVYNLALDEQFGKLRQMAINENNSSIPTLKKENIPWRLGFEPEAKKELKRVDELWKDVRKRLIENGSYCILRDFQLTDN